MKRREFIVGSTWWSGGGVGRLARFGYGREGSAPIAAQIRRLRYRRAG